MKLSLWMLTIGVLASSLVAQEKKEVKEETQATSIFDAAKKSRLNVNLRLGYEYSSTDDLLAPGQNLSLRTRFGFKTAKYEDHRIVVQGQLVNNLIEEHRFPGGGDQSRDIVADPDGVRIHQAYLDNTGLPSTLVRAGRQEIIFDDARLIGNVGWRQFAQSFDGLLIKNTSIDNLAINMSWVGQVNTIFNTELDLKHFGLINAKYSNEAINLALFTYMLDMEGVSNRDSITYGARANGKIALFDYDVTLAQQDDFANSAGHNAYMTNYYAGLQTGPVHFGAGYSRISGARSGDSAFDTLFSTAHGYNGWADQFLATNGGNLRAGLQDSYIDVKAEAYDTVILLRYHSFRTTEEGAGAHSGEYGDELDLMFKRSFTIADSNTINMIIQFALYNETNGVASNTTTDEFLTSIRMEYTF